MDKGNYPRNGDGSGVPSDSQDSTYASDAVDAADTSSPYPTDAADIGPPVNGGDAEARKTPVQTRKAILDAAFHQIYRKGFQGAGLNEIIEKSGLTKGALYHHFKDKKQLSYAVVDETIAQKVWQ